MMGLAIKKSTLEVEGLHIELVQKKMKNVLIRISPPLGQIRVSAPLHYSREKILISLRERVGWMRKHQLNFVAKYETALLKKESRPDARSRNVLEKELSFLVQKWSLILNVKVASWKIRQMKTKWGSCNVTEHKILFNLELAKQSLACVEYVVAHELIHLIEPSHNARFKRFMSEAIPNWKQLKEELSMDCFL